MTPRDHRFQNLLNDLRRQVSLSFAPGQILPPKRELAQNHGVSPSTVQRALAVLVNEGSVIARPRIGWVRTDRSGGAAQAGRPAALRVGIMTPRARDEWPDHDMYPALIQEIERRGMTVVEVPHRFEGRQRSTPNRRRIELARVPWNIFDVGLLVDGEDTIAGGAAILRGRPILSVDLDATPHGIDSVAFPDAQAGAMAARHLMQMGHRFFALTDENNAVGFAWDPAWTRRRHGFEAAAGEAGGVIARQRLGITRHGGNLRKETFFEQELPAVVKSWATAPRSTRPTALFLLDPNMLKPIVDELTKYDLRVPRDMSIITVTWNQRVYGGAEPVLDGIRYTAIDFDLSTLIHTVGAAVEEIAAGRALRNGKASTDAKLFTASATLLPGNSTAAPIKR
jgi:hypothetical protein